MIVRSFVPRRLRHIGILAASALSALAIVGQASPAHGTETLRFTDTEPGGVLAIGNTLGLSKGSHENGPGLLDSIGTFITLGAGFDNAPANPLNPWPEGTTPTWAQNGSTAVLSLGEGTRVLYAELVWGGSYNYVTENVTANIDDSVTLEVAGGDSLTVSPDPDTALTISQLSYSGLFMANYYLRSANVTDFVALHGAGTYATLGVPATQDMSVDDLNAAGWTLVVAYRNESEPMRNLSIFVGGSWVDEDSQQDYEVSGFCAPPYGPVDGHVVVSALEGDANRVGDMLAIAATSAGPFVLLSGPNNPENNFFCSQINGPDGQVDTQGSFGTVNHDAIGGVNVVGGRQGWDVTTVAVSSQAGHLSNGQTSAVVRTETVGDSYVPALVGFAIDVKSPDFNGGGSTTTPSKTEVEIGDHFTVTAKLENTGEAPAVNLMLQLPLDAGLALTGFMTDGSSGDINGDAVTAPELVDGVAEGTLDVGSTREIMLGVDVVGPPSDGATFHFVPTWKHGFQMCDGGQMISGSYTSQLAAVSYFDNSGGQGGAGGAVPTGGMGGAGNTGPIAPGVTADPDAEGNCGCVTPGRRGLGASGGWAALGLGLGASVLRRRRRG